MDMKVSLQRLLRPMRIGAAMLAGAACVVSINGVASAAPVPSGESAGVRALPYGCAPVTEDGKKLVRCTFEYVGAADQSLDLDGIDEITVKAWGAGGGGVAGNGTTPYWSSQGGGGAGGYYTATLRVDDIDALGILVGQGGGAAGTALGATYGGGGPGGNVKGGVTQNARGSAGGGMSAVFDGGTVNEWGHLSGTLTADSALLIAGGGGGASPGSGSSAGNGGGPDGGYPDRPQTNGRGGTQDAGGASATSTTGCSPLGRLATQFTGAGGYSAMTTTPTTYANPEGGGGGGGGWFGGGGGRCQSESDGGDPAKDNGTGAGGSGYRDTTRTGAWNWNRGTPGTVGSTAQGIPGTHGMPFTDVSGYVAGAAEGGPITAATNAPGGHGLVVVEWEDSSDYTMTVSTDRAVQQDVLTYDITLTNTGIRDYTEENPADLTVDLSEVLTGAEYDASSFTASSSLDSLGRAGSDWTADLQGDNLKLSGPLAEDEKVDFSFDVKVKDKDEATNFTLVTGISSTMPNGECADDSCVTEVLVARDLELTLSASEVEQHKSVDYAATLYYGNGTDESEDVTDDVTVAGVPEETPEAGKITPNELGDFDAVATWTQNGQSYESNEEPLTVVINIDMTKDQAKLDLKAAADAAKQAIDALEHLTGDQKVAAKEQIDDEYNAGVTAIDDATIAAGALEAQADAEAEFDNTVAEATLQDAKNSAVKELQDKAASVKDAIDALKNVSDEDKATAKAKIDDILSDAIDEVNAADNAGDIDSIVEDAKVEMDQVYTDLAAQAAENLKQAKDKAKADLADAAQAAKDKIDTMVNLSDDEKVIEKSRIDGAYEAGVAAIDDATTADEANQAKTSAESEFDGIVDDAALQDAKNGAVKELQEKAASVKDAIDALKNVSDEDKATAKAEIDRILAEGIDNVNAAGTIADVNSAATTAKVEMDQVYTDLAEQGTTNLANAKDKAKGDLADAAQAAKDKIDAMVNLSDDEKLAEKSRVDGAYDAGVAAIDEATTIEEANQAKINAESEFDGIVDDAALQDAKNGAVKELEEKAASVKDAIDQLTDVSDEDKATAKAEIDRILAEGIDNVNGSWTIADVSSAATTAKVEMDQVYTDLAAKSAENLQNAKDKAKADLADAAQAAKDKIDAMVNLSDDEKLAEKSRVDGAYDAGVTAIDDATTADEANQAKINAESEFDGIVDDAALQDAKNGAVKELQDKAASVKDAIDQLTDVSDEDKATAKAEIDRILAEGIDNVNGSWTIADVNSAATTAKAEMDQVYTDLAAKAAGNLQESKDKAKQDLADAAQAAKDKIDAMVNLSDEEKAAEKSRVDDAYEAGASAIDDASTATEANQAKTEAESEINGIVDDAALQDAKNGAVKELEDKAASVKDAIDQLTDVSDEDKAAAKAEIDRILEDAIDDVNAAGSVDEVRSTTDTAKAEMDQVYTDLADQAAANLKQAKDKAKQDLADAAQAAKDKIDAMVNLSDEEKAAEKSRVDDAYEAGVAAIDDASTATEANQAKTEAESEINGIVDDAALQDAKNGAVKELEDKAASVKDAIDQLTDVSDEDKAAAKAEIDRILEDAIDDVNAAGSVDEVRSTTDTAKAEMDQVYTDLAGQSAENLQNAKDKAKQDLADAAQAAKDKIDAMVNLSDEEKAAEKSRVDGAYDAGVAAIDEAATAEEAGQAKTEAESEIGGIVDDAALQDAKNGAVKELEEKAASVKDAIDKLAGVSDEEKAAAKAEIDRILQDAIEKIDASESIDSIESIVTSAKAEMDQVYTDLASRPAPVTPEPPAAGLPNTGVAAGSLIGIAALLAFAGVLLVSRSRRTDYAEESR